jgi:hypothetical protein
MRKIALIALLSVMSTPSFAVQFGIGTAIDDTTLYFPIRTEHYIIEPFFAYYDETDGSYTFQGDSYGIGIFRVAPATDKIALYFGGRLGLISNEDTDPDYGTYSDEGTLISPVVGAQYSISPDFTIAIEHRIEYISGDQDQPTSTTVLHLDLDSTNSESALVARIFF